MLNQSGYDIVMSENLVDDCQEICVKGCSEKYFAPDPVSAGDILCPDVMIQWIHGGGEEMRIAFDLKKIDQLQEKGQKENAKQKQPFFVFVWHLLKHMKNISIL